MARIELEDFQQKAVNQLVDTALDYFVGEPDKIGGRPVPFVGQLKAVTGAGKTPILANAVGRLAPAIVLWTTKYGSVADQTFTNLTTGGKYHHLFGQPNVEVVKFSEIPSYAAWQRILERTTGLTILVSTVAAWNSSLKDERLNVHRVHRDWGPTSRWTQLKTDRKRPLWVVYDEAHNSTSEQVEQLDDLDPAGFFVASASPVKGKLQYYLTFLPPAVRERRIAAIQTKAVVEAQFLKASIAVADYDSGPDEMIRDAAAKRQELDDALRAADSHTTAKAIYVVESSNTAKGETPRPLAIWNTLTTQCGVPIDVIAVCTDTKGLPKEVAQVKTLDQLDERFTHIIFNKKLQEGWDDPAVYICYFDGKTDSASRIQQVIGRALRQPGRKHFEGNDDLNSAFFYVNCPTEALEGIVDELKEELRIYKDGEEDDFEPFQFKEVRKAIPRIPLRSDVGPLRAPRLQLELPSPDQLQRLLKKKTYDFNADDRAAPGRAMITVVSVKTGKETQQSRDLLEDMRVSCGRYLQDQIRALSKNCLNALNPALFATPPLEKSACYRSKALVHYRELAIELVAAYENHVRLASLADPDEQDYTVGPYQPSGAAQKPFDHAAHPHYDAKAFNPDELEMAKALDKFEHAWARNKDRVDYGIPLPVKSGSSSTFYPDFLWWVNDTVWAIDPTGKHILDEKIRAKLLNVPDPLRIALVTRGRLDASFKKVGEDGWSLVRLRLGNPAPEIFETLADMLTTLEAESLAEEPAAT